ncbi:methyltransferase domain-containing protein [Candidatus Reidiella endopervernicosa]|nr:methyltransferase domain-containing protein [Candidatus Reidiella endopervernicosa]
MASREEALAYPQQDIELAICKSCGFIQNIHFDPSYHEYSERYEETQGYSAHFRSFLNEFVDELIERHQLHNRTVVEIGCGKGEFLSLLCRQGNNRGIGIDASYVPGRIAEHADLDLTFIQGFFEEHTDVIAVAEVIICRHTLEHIARPAEFMHKLREAIPEGSRPLIIFDLPDTTRVLEERAFWDVYYEHCAYFTPTSLAALFRQEGLAPQTLYRRYGEQMLVVEAYPDETGDKQTFSLERPVAELVTLSDEFSQSVERTVDGWSQRVQRANQAGQRVVLWGSGSKAVSFISALGNGCRIDAVVDINPHRQGSYMAGSGYEISAPASLAALQPDLVIVMNPVYEQEIAAELKQLGVKTELVSL